MSTDLTTTETTKVTKQLCIDYIKSQNTNLTDGEFAQYAALATTLNLNPFLREIYPIKYNGRMTLVTGYQVYIKRAESFPTFDGYDTAFEGEGKNLSCICRVYRKDRNHPTEARVFLSEYTQGNSMWNSKPHVMLEKVAIGTAFRRAFPIDFAGMPYTSEEIRGEEQLQQQGYTEVKPEQPTEDDRQKAFFAKMSDLAKLSPELYANVLRACGYNNEAEVKPEDMRKVYKTVKAEIEKAAEAAKSEETNNEKET